MRKHLIIPAALLALAGAVAVGTTVSYAVFASTRRHITQIAVEGPHNTLLFLSPGTWEVDNPEYRLYAWNANASSTTFISPLMKNVEEYYVFELDTSIYIHLIFARMKEGQATLENYVANNENMWNKTSDLDYSSSTNLYEITGWGTPGQKISTGQWSNYS